MHGLLLAMNGSIAGRSPRHLATTSHRNSLLASHQLSMMMMASRHRCRHRADSPQDDSITPSSSSSGIAPPLPRDGITPSSPPRGSITPPSSPHGVAPQPAASGIAPPTASTSRRRPPHRMEYAATSNLRALIPNVGAAPRSPSSPSTSHSLYLSCFSSHEHTHTG